MFLNATDVQPNHLVAQLGEKYKGIPPEVLRDQPEFFNDLLRHEVDMTVRLVVHYKGLNMGMVRSAFQESLGNRIKKVCSFKCPCPFYHG
jgi:DNA polymerase III epsilon subunit-like protein